MSGVDNFLAHYGVKGMKWGVRKNRTTATESRSLRKESRTAYRKHSEEVFGRRLGDRDLSPADYKKLSTANEIINRGATLKRVAASPDTVLRGRTYVSHLPEDSALYRAVLPTHDRPIFAFGGRRSYKQNYELELKTVKKLKAPSEKERIDTFIELMSEPRIKVSGASKPITGREYLSRIGYSSEMKKLSDQEAGLRFYRKLNEDAGAEKNRLNTAYFDKIKEKGYNAISDDNDRRYLAKAPLILLDPERTVKVTSVRPLTADEINAEQRRLSS